MRGARPGVYYHGTLCWKCHRADHWEDEPIQCPWATKFEPVEGWVADHAPLHQYDIHKRQNKITDSYFVIECPLFMPTKRSTENVPKQRRQTHDKETAERL